MYGLPQAGLLAQELLEERLAAEEYYQSTHTHLGYGHMRGG